MLFSSSSARQFQRGAIVLALCFPRWGHESNQWVILEQLISPRMTDLTQSGASVGQGARMVFQGEESSLRAAALPIGYSILPKSNFPFFCSEAGSFPCMSFPAAQSEQGLNGEPGQERGMRRSAFLCDNSVLIVFIIFSSDLLADQREQRKFSLQRGLGRICAH